MENERANERLDTGHGGHSDSGSQDESIADPSVVSGNKKSRLEENNDMGISPTSRFFVFVTLRTMRYRRSVGLGHEIMPYVKALVDVGAIPHLTSPNLKVIIDTQTCGGVQDSGTEIEVWEVPE